MRRLAVLVMLLSAAAGVTLAAQVQTRLFGIGANITPAEAFFSDARVQEIRLTISQRDWQALKDDFGANTYYAADFRWGNAVIRNIGIRSRGSGSRSGTKPGLRVDFDRYATDQTFLGLKSFILRNNTQDPSNMHERLAMQMYKHMGVPAAREAFAKLYINDQYAGIYTVVESVDKAFLRRVFGEDAGYLYEFDYPDDPETIPYYFEYRGPEVELYVPSPFKPATHESAPMGEMIERWLWAINLTEGGFREAMVDYLDLEKFLRFLAVEEFVAETDGFLGNYGVSNFYVYRPDGAHPFTFIPWDRSESFKGGVHESIFHNLINVPMLNQLALHTMEYQDLFNSYLNALLECARFSAEPAAGVAGGWMEREIQREYTQIRDAARADPFKPFSNDDFEQAVQGLLEFARERSAIVAGEIERYRNPVSEPEARRRYLRD